MRPSANLLPGTSSLHMRLLRLASLDEGAAEALRKAERHQHRSPARREIVVEGAPSTAPRAVLGGWACRQRILFDGRRQILGILLPGDLIGASRGTGPMAETSILAITDVVTCPLPDAGADAGGLAEAYAASAALDEHYLLAHITRLGRFTAKERLVDWILEIRDRLGMAGLLADDQFTVPLTQELLADTLGLTSVHVNRTLQGLRRDGLVAFRGRTIALPDRRGLENLVGYTPARAARSA